MQRLEPLRSQRTLVRLRPLSRVDLRRVATLDGYTRADCENGPRPCPRVRCRYHLGLDVSPDGTIIYPAGALEPWQVRSTCALDVAEQGPQKRPEVARLLGMQRGAFHSFERMTLLKVRALLEGTIAHGIRGEEACDLCGRRSIGWLSACPSHALTFGRSKAGGLVASGRVALAAAWEAWVDSRP